MLSTAICVCAVATTFAIVSKTHLKRRLGRTSIIQSFQDDGKCKADHEEDSLHYRRPTCTSGTCFWLMSSLRLSDLQLYSDDAIHIANWGIAVLMLPAQVLVKKVGHGGRRGKDAEEEEND